MLSKTIRNGLSCSVGRRGSCSFLATATAFTLCAPSAEATWSIIIVDTRTQEVAIGSATCLTNYDLKQLSPVVIVGIGAAAAQAQIDSGANNRTYIHQKMFLGWDPTDIILGLEEQDRFHQSRQYGIVDVQGRAATFTGTDTFSWAGGVTGQVGDLVYSIQGNILTGECVVFETEQAILNTPGDVPEKLMAAMEAARGTGGDGRCSCQDGGAEDCGCPPPVFDKSAHIGYMVVARLGDMDGTCGSQYGCANGDYFMSFNIARQSVSDPDPVYQLRDLFNAWRTDLVGRPDGVQSLVTVDQPLLAPDGESRALLDITLLDWQGNPINVPFADISVERHSSSDGVTSLGPIVDLGNGHYQMEVTARMREGVDRYVFVVDDGLRPVTLSPLPEVHVEVPDGSFKLLDPVPGFSGQQNTLCIGAGVPDSRVLFLYSLIEGVYHSECGPLSLKSPMLAGQATVELDGSACINMNVPTGASGRAVYMQAIQRPDCAISNAVRWVFRKQ